MFIRYKEIRKGFRRFSSSVQETVPTDVQYVEIAVSPDPLTEDREFTDMSQALCLATGLTHEHDEIAVVYEEGDAIHIVVHFGVFTITTSEFTLPGSSFGGPVPMTDITLTPLSSDSDNPF